MKAAETKLKRLFTHDWEAKLICLVLAMLLWWVVSEEIKRGNPNNTNESAPQLPSGWPLGNPNPAPAPAPSVPTIPGVSR